MCPNNVWKLVLVCQPSSLWPTCINYYHKFNNSGNIKVYAHNVHYSIHANEMAI